MATEAQKRASRKYYEKHKDYYKQKEKESIKRIRQKRWIYESRIEEAINYIRELKANAPEEKALDRILEILGVEND